jgi:putative nucleotidyltransferase with HDIG domain
MKTLFTTDYKDQEKNLPRAFAEALLENAVAKNPGPWREHSYAVAQAAEKNARATQVLDPDFAYICGLLHDIGRQMGHTYIAHVYDGYYYLKNLGYDKLAKICLTHSFNLFEKMTGKDLYEVIS